MSKRKPRIATARQGTAFDGVFDPPSDSPTGLHPDAATSGDARQATSGLPAGTAPTGSTPTDAARSSVPEPGDPDHDRIVQANWTVPAWLRAKVRAIKDHDGTGQNEVVAAAIERYVAEREQERGEAYPVQARHFR